MAHIGYSWPPYKITYVSIYGECHPGQASRPPWLFPHLIPYNVVVGALPDLVPSHMPSQKDLNHYYSLNLRWLLHARPQ